MWVRVLQRAKLWWYAERFDGPQEGWEKRRGERGYGCATTTTTRTRIMPLPELIASPDDSMSRLEAAVVPPARCGVPSDDASFHLNWYWPRVAVGGGAAGSDSSAELVCEARRTHSIALPAAAARRYPPSTRPSGASLRTPTRAGA